MCHHIIGAVQVTVEAGIGQNHTGYTTYSEQEDETKRPHHRWAKGDRSAPHGGNPRENLNAGWHRDDHGCGGEVSLGVNRKANVIHVMCPHNEPNNADSHHGISHAEITENWLA